MSLKKLSFRLQSVCPLLMHSPITADPLHPLTKMLKEINKKKSHKTDADHERVAEIEFKAGLYMGKSGPVLTPDIVPATLTAAAKRTKRGKDAAIGLFVEQAADLKYSGPRDADKLFSDPNFRHFCGVKVGQSRVMRTRPIFREWTATINVVYDDGVFNESDVRGIVKTAGEVCGFCDWRPRYGRFKVVQEC